MFKNVCLGGTFDGIHAGHKILFREATRLCKERLVVGVTDESMIKNKILWELIAPVSDRIERVKECLREINSNIVNDVVPISDIYGPTIVEKDLECIVVSEETVKGAEKINQARVGKGWPELKVQIISLVQDNDSSHQNDMNRLKENKVSSSLIRLNKLGSILKPPIPNVNIPKRPYLIGLTGGVASGKTSIVKYLETFGFGCINYDLLGHKTYENVGSPTYNQILDYFGPTILNETGGGIERSKLGKIVFNDPTKLKKLNEIVWPAIYSLVDEKLEELKSDHEVIVLESALLIESGQTKRVHQLWTCIVPPEEAVRRQMVYRSLSKEEAEKRVNAQTDNVTRVRSSNAIFCTMWEPEFTQQQVRKCVAELRQKYL